MQHMPAPEDAVRQLDEKRVVSYSKLEEIANALRTLGKKIVLTSGSFDLTHIGHYRYLAAARSFGDVLIVGVDDDDKIRRRKGADRPVVPQDDRLEDVSFQASVDYVFLKLDGDPHWELVRAVRPDILVATRETYTPEQIEELEADYCGEVFVLDPMATTSTSAHIRKIHMGLAARLSDAMQVEFPGFVERVVEGVTDGKRSE